MINNVSQLHPNTQLYIISPHFPLPEHRRISDELYRFWKEIWNSTYLELEGQGVKESDEFLRQCEICAVVANNEVIGSLSFQWFDLSLQSHREHSYFQIYPQHVLDNMAALGATKIMTIAQMAVSPKWRKSSHGPFVSEILMGAACKRMAQWGVDGAIAYTRNNRKVNELFYRHGARCLLEQQKQHNVEVDFVIILRNEARPSNVPGLSHEIERLWHNRTDSTGGLSQNFSKNAVAA